MWRTDADVGVGCGGGPRAEVAHRGLERGALFGERLPCIARKMNAVGANDPVGW